MKTKNILSTLALTLGLACAVPLSAQTNKLTFDVSLYGLLAGMSGNAGIGPVNADVDVGFKQVWDNLKFGAMGTARVGYERLAFSTEIIYMDLEATKGPATLTAQQWLVQPALSYRLCRYFEPYVSTRYNNLSMAISGTGPLGNVRATSDTQDWWDPIIGGRVMLPLGEKFSFNVIGDIGGFSVGSDLTWQVYPYFNWRLSKVVSLQAGYRLLYTDYETGSGLSRFKYDVLSAGPQLGVTLHF